MIVLRQEGIPANIKFRFVDDGGVGLRPIRVGCRWETGGMCYNEEKRNT